MPGIAGSESTERTKRLACILLLIFTLGGCVVDIPAERVIELGTKLEI